MYLGLSFSRSSQISTVKHHIIFCHVVPNNLENDIEMTNNSIVPIFCLSKKLQVLSDPHTKNICELANQSTKF
jgi:hypothetical protein